MHSLCSDPTNPGYKGVGGRGLKVAREWTEFRPFLSWELANGPERGKQMARVDPRKGFRLQNFTWLPREQAHLHRRRPDHGLGPRRLISAFGESKGLMEWIRAPQMNSQTHASQVNRPPPTCTALS